MKVPEAPNTGFSERKISASLEAEIEALTRELGQPPDLEIRQFFIGGRAGWTTAAVYMEGLADETKVINNIISPLMLWARPAFIEEVSKRELFGQIPGILSPAQKFVRITSFCSLVQSVLDGDTVLLIDGFDEALGIESKGYPAREVETPEAEVAVRGPREAFNETLRSNIALVRKRLKHPSLRLEQFLIGRKSRTKVAMMYLEHIAPDSIVREVRRRVSEVDIDVLLDAGILEALITDHPYSLFPMIRTTERPDAVVASLNSGRIAVAVDNSPFMLTMPTEFFDAFGVAEDYYSKFYIGSALRLMRFSAFVISVFFTPFYVALVTFHQELLPLSLLLNVTATQRGVPFPVALTAVAVEIVLEILREAGLRLPRAVGQAVSIVGAIVLGQAAVQAGFAPPGVVIVTATATIASFAVPGFEPTVGVRLLRFPLLILASVFGLFGVALGAVALVVHLSSLKSLGVPFFSFYSPGRVSELGDKVVIVPARESRPVRPGAETDRVRRSRPPKPEDPDSKEAEANW